MATKAKTQQEVDQMSKKDRLWDSLSNSYGEKTAESNKAYDQAISQADRQLQSRGLGRSSYGAQVTAGLLNQKIGAQNKINSELIADYENRLSQIESEEAEADRWERQFAENQRQFNAGQELTKSENALNRALQERQISNEEANTKWSQNFQEKQADIAQQNTLWSQNFQKEQADLAQQNTVWNQNFQKEQADIAQQNTLWNQRFQQEQADISQQNTLWNQKFQESEAARNQKNTEASLELQNKQYDLQLQQWQKQVEQWDQTFEYNKMSDEQKTAYNTVISILGNGGDPSDELLAKAGISRADANAMKKQAAASGGSGSGSKSGTNGTGTTPTDADVEGEFNPVPALNLADSIMNSLNQPGLALKLRAQEEEEKAKAKDKEKANTKLSEQNSKKKGTTTSWY